MKLSVRDMILVAFFAALMAVGAFISKIWPPEIIPFSLLPLLSLLAGAVIGPGLGALSIIVYILVGLIGLPVFASAPYGGFTYALQPSFGFLLSFVIAAYIAGFIIHRRENPGWKTFFIASITGIISIYLFGLPWMYMIFNFYLGKALSFKAIIIMMSLYMALDLVKAILASIIGKNIYEKIKVSTNR